MPSATAASMSSLRSSAAVRALSAGAAVADARFDVPTRGRTFRSEPIPCALLRRPLAFALLTSVTRSDSADLYDSIYQQSSVRVRATMCEVGYTQSAHDASWWSSAQ